MGHDGSVGEHWTVSKGDRGLNPPSAALKLGQFH